MFSCYILSPNVQNKALSTTVWNRSSCTLVIFHKKLFHWSLLVRNCKVKPLFSPVRERLARERVFLKSPGWETSPGREKFFGVPLPVWATQVLAPEFGDRLQF